MIDIDIDIDVTDIIEVTGTIGIETGKSSALMHQVFETREILIDDRYRYQ